MAVIVGENVDTCPHCEHDNLIKDWDVAKKGWVATCEECGEDIMLCDSCMHADDNECHCCDWHEEEVNDVTCGVCSRGITVPKETYVLDKLSILRFFVNRAFEDNVHAPSKALEELLANYEKELQLFCKENWFEIEDASHPCDTYGDGSDLLRWRNGM